MSEITLPTPDGDQEFNLKLFHGGGDALLTYDRSPVVGTTEGTTYMLVKEITILLPLNVLHALIDAAQHPVCPACGSKLSLNYHNWKEKKSGWAICGIDFENPSACHAFGPAFEFAWLPSWLDHELAAIAALRSPAVIWKWLENLKGDSNE